LKEADTPEEFARRIGERAKTTPGGEWILGGDWDDQRWTPALLPTKELIDPVTPATPVFVNRYDGHMSLANSAALKIAGVTAQTADPPGGTIVRDAQSTPTGVLKDAAMNCVDRVIPPMTSDRRLHAVKRALEHAASVGVTSVQDMNPAYDDIAVYAELANRGELTARIYAAPLETQWQDQARVGVHRSFGSAWLRIGAVKGYADGSLGSTTAYFFQPYTDAPNTRGLLSDEMQPLDAMRDRLIGADRAGLQLCMHAIGDAGISQMLDLFGEVVGVNGERDRRLRIEHAQHIAPKDFERFAALKAIASVQPYHAIDDGRWAERRIGPERIKTTYAFRTLLDKGVRLALGTDWYVAPLNPMLTLYAATTRATLGGKHPNQRAARRRKRRSAPSDLSALQLVRRDDAEQVERQRSDVGEDRELRETAADGERGDDRRVRDDGEVRCAKTRMNSSEHVWEDAVGRQREERPRATRHVARAGPEHRDRAR